MATSSLVRELRGCTATANIRERCGVECLKATGLSRTPTRDALPQELTTPRLVEGHEVSCGGNGSQSQIHCQAGNCPKPRFRGHLTGGPGV
jgi:hypothetical protein